MRSEQLTYANISFYVHRSAETPWRKSKRSHQDNPAAQTVLPALTLAILVEAFIMIGASFATPYLFQATETFLEILGSLLFYPLGRCRRREALSDPETYFGCMPNVR